MSTSPARKNINKLISDKMHNRADRLHKAGSDLDAVGSVLSDYSLYFSGSLEALQASGLAADDFKPVVLAVETNEAELKLLEARMNLEQALSGEEDE